MSTKVLGVLGGEDVDDDLLARWAQSADAVFAADGAANRLARLGIPFHAVVGDMDSVESWALTGSEVVHMPDQETTDCDKLLSYCAMRGFQSVTLAGIEGNLPDHVLAIVHSCLRTPLRTRLAYRTGMGWALESHSRLEVECTVGARVSLLPLMDTTDVSLSGVAWPLAGASLHPAGPTSISNSASSERVVASIGHGSVLLYIGYSQRAMPFWDLVSE